MKKLSVGIRIDPSHVKHSAALETMTFRISVGPPQRGMIFISNPTISATIEKHPGLVHQEIGDIAVHVDSHARTMSTHRFFPFGQKEDSPGRAFQGKGIGTIIELSIEKSLKKRYPDHTIYSTINAQPSRIAQIMRRGRTPGKPIAIHEAHALTRKAAIIGHRLRKK